MGASFARQPGPLLVDVIKDDSCKGLIASIRNGTIAGAMGFDVHVSRLPEREQTAEKMRSVFGCTQLPTLALHYDNSIPDEGRTAILRTAAEAGASCVDMQGYTFGDRHPKATLVGSMYSFADAEPDEVTLDENVIARQCAFIDEIHAMGKEVLLSNHTLKFMDCRRTADLVEFLLKRKPDVIKLVGWCATDEQLAEYFRTVLFLKAQDYPARIHYHCSGPLSKATRFIGPMLGSYLMFCIDRYDAYADVNQLPLREMLSVYGIWDRL